MSFLNISVLVVVILACNYVSEGSGQCPPPHRVNSNKPTCFSDADCRKWGQVCCRNQYNTKSCVDRAPWQNNQKYSGGGAGGVMCDGVKCKPYEICKRHKCQRP